MEGKKQVAKEQLRSWRKQGEQILPSATKCLQWPKTRETHNHPSCFRDAPLSRDQPLTEEGSLSDSSSAGTLKPVSATRGHFVGSERECEGNQSVPHRHLNLQPQPRRHSDLQMTSPSSLQPRPPPRLPGQAFPRGPLAGPTTSFRGRFPGPSPAWHRGWRPAGNAALLWGFQHIRRDFPNARPGYRNPAGQGSRGRRGRSFNRM